MPGERNGGKRIMNGEIMDFILEKHFIQAVNRVVTLVKK